MVMVVKGVVVAVGMVVMIGSHRRKMVNGVRSKSRQREANVLEKSMSPINFLLCFPQHLPNIFFTIFLRKLTEKIM